MAIQNDTTNLDRLGWALSELHSTLDRIKQAAIDIIDVSGTGGSVADVCTLADDIKRLTSYAGLLTETEAAKLNLDSPFIGYEGWIVPPLYQLPPEHNEPQTTP